MAILILINLNILPATGLYQIRYLSGTCGKLSNRWASLLTRFNEQFRPCQKIKLANRLVFIPSIANNWAFFGAGFIRWY